MDQIRPGPDRQSDEGHADRPGDHADVVVPREDVSRKVQAQQLALAIRDEVVDLEKAGIKIVQIDEAAFREGLLLRRAAWQDYLDWAVEAFRLRVGRDR